MNKLHSSCSILATDNILTQFNKIPTITVTTDTHKVGILDQAITITYNTPEELFLAGKLIGSITTKTLQ